MSGPVEEYGSLRLGRKTQIQHDIALACQNLRTDIPDLFVTPPYPIHHPRVIKRGHVFGEQRLHPLVN